VEVETRNGAIGLRPVKMIQQDQEYFFTKEWQEKEAENQLERLLSDCHHPVINTKKMQDPRNIWECRVTKGFRFAFQIYDNLYFLRRIRTHDLLKKQ
jgi:hypothetical protein